MAHCLLRHTGHCPSGRQSVICGIRGAQVWLKQSIPAPALPAGPQGTIVKAQSTLVADQRPTGA